MKLKLNDLLVKVLDIYLGYLCENKDIYILLNFLFFILIKFYGFIYE